MWFWWFILICDCLIPFYGASDDTIGISSIIIIVIQLVFLIGSIFPTEKSLKNNFNEDGTRR